MIVCQNRRVAEPHCSDRVDAAFLELRPVKSRVDQLALGIRFIEPLASA